MLRIQSIPIWRDSSKLHDVYTDCLLYTSVVVPDAIPPIVPLELFDDVQEKIAKNKKAPARRKDVYKRQLQDNEYIR